MLIRGAEVAGRPCDVRCTGERISEIASSLHARPDEEILDARGGALIPGLHDHHIHLHALAAALASIRCGPPEVESREDLARALSAEPDEQGWLRGTGYFESVAGPLDRSVLDGLRKDVPLRVQHRSGAMWFLNSRAIEALEIEDRASPAQGNSVSEVARIERDSAGRPTGRLFRADRWIRKRLPTRAPPELAETGRRLASYGVTSVTDATPSNAAGEAERFLAAQAAGTLPQRVLMMGALDDRGESLLDPSMGIALRSPLEPATGSGPGNDVRLGAHKIMLDEPDLPDLQRLEETIARAHGKGRAVAIHTVTRAEIHFALAALEAAGPLVGDRLEHASVAPLEAVELVGRLGLTIVTQPNFLAERGDAYRNDVEERDLPHLYRVRSWLDAGIRLGGGTDAPFGHPDPWRAMRAAVERRTPEGDSLGASECVSPETALALFMPEFSRAAQPETELSPALQVGDLADLCLLSVPWAQARGDLSSSHVAATLRGGELVYST